MSRNIYFMCQISDGKFMTNYYEFNRTGTHEELHVPVSATAYLNSF